MPNFRLPSSIIKTKSLKVVDPLAENTRIKRVIIYGWLIASSAEVYIIIFFITNIRSESNYLEHSASIVTLETSKVNVERNAAYLVIHSQASGWSRKLKELNVVLRIY